MKTKKNFFCNLVHRCQYFFYILYIAKMKLTLHFYFQIPSAINQPWPTSAIQQKAYPAEWDQNKAPINRKKTFEPSEQPLRKKSVFPFHSRQNTEWQQQTSVLQPQQLLVTDNICWKPPILYNDDNNSWVTPYCNSTTKCKLHYKMGRDWVVSL